MINPALYHLWGPLVVHAYGVCIAIGAILSFYLLCHDKKTRDLASMETLTALLYLILIFGFLGGRLVTILADQTIWQDPWCLFRFWEPGLSVLGTVIGATGAIILFLRLKKIPVLALIDRIIIFAPLAQSFGRLGCFFAGCCHGLPTNHILSVTYTHVNHLAPLHCALHPTQLYSALALLLLFIFLYFYMQYHTNKAGMLFCIYLLATAIERFSIDFIRGDRTFVSTCEPWAWLSLHQWLALAIACCALLGMAYLAIRKE